MKTPQNQMPKLANIIEVPKLYFKREDLHPYGSHKGRSIPQMIEHYIKKGWHDFVISSSGNAAIASGLFVKKLNQKRKEKITLTIFVGKKINKEKLKLLKKIEDRQITVKQTERPKQEAFAMDKKHLAKNLRQSTDRLALLGYKTLAEELKKIKNLTAVFVPTSSGTTAEALGKYLGKTQIHIVQTAYCHPIAEEFDKNFENSAKISIASAIVDSVAHRQKKVMDIIKKTKGFGWIVSDKKINEAIRLVKKNTGIQISPNSALSVAGLIKAKENSWNFKGAVVCLITGK